MNKQWKNTYQSIKNIYHLLQAHWWRTWYGQPDQRLHIYGITGTNGKTTTAHILTSIFKHAYGLQRTGMLTTIAFTIGATKEVNKTKMTTLPSRQIFAFLKRMVDAGVTHVVVEVTSHALDQHRLAGITLDGAIILNIAREHLDYHHTMAEYVDAKAKIINYLKPKAPLIINKELQQFSSLQPQMIKNETITFTSQQAASVSTPLPGRINKENALAASLLARAVGISPDLIKTGIASVTHVPGRMEWVAAATGPRVLIDYAVTPDALARLYDELRAQVSGKIWGVLGAAGLRDRGKRPDMARVVAERADHLILTREDPWTEDEEQIFKDLENGLTQHKNWQRILDRRQAIHHCLQQAGPEDVIVVTGKGAEEGMAVGQEIIPWSDRQVVTELVLKKPSYV